MDEWREEVLDGGLKVFCSPDHRFGTDAFLLADFAAPRPGETVCDLGTGCGIIPFLWLRPPFPRTEAGAGIPRGPKHIYGVEIQEQGVRQFVRGVEANGVEETVVPVWADLTHREALRAFVNPGALDMVCCNPPYKPARTGLLSREESHRIARHETFCTLEEVCGTAAWLLKFGGRFCLCLRPERLAEAFAACADAGLVPKRLRFVAQRPGREPWLFLLEGKKGAKPGLRVLPELLVEQALPEGGTAFSPEMLRIYHKENPLPRKEGKRDGQECK